MEREIGKGKRERKIINATDAMFPSKKDAPTQVRRRRMMVMMMMMMRMMMMLMRMIKRKLTTVWMIFSVFQLPVYHFHHPLQESWLNEMSEGLGGVVKIIGNNKTLKGAEKKMVKKKKKKMLEEEDDEEDDYEDEDDGEEKNHAGEKNDVEKVGDDDDEEEEEEEEEDNKRLQLSYNAPVRREDKKSEKTRRKMGERKEQADKHLRQKRLKKEMSQTFRWSC